MSAMMDMLSQALRKPVQILEMNDNSVFQTGENMVWMAVNRSQQIMIGKPTRVT